MPVTEIEIYEALKEKIGESSAKILIEFIDLRVEKEFERKKDILATKQDIAELRSANKQDIEELKTVTKQDIAELRSANKQDIEELKTATKQDIAELRSANKQDIEELKTTTNQEIARLEVKIERLKSELETKIEKTKTELIKWMFIFWAGQIGVLLAILALFFRILR